MGREVASAIGRWCALLDLPVRLELTRRLRLCRKRCAIGSGESRSVTSSHGRLPRAAAERRGCGLRRRAASSARGDLPRRAARGERPARGEAVRHRPRRGAQDPRRRRASSGASSAARRSFRFCPACKRSGSICARRELGHVLEIRSRLLARERSRSDEADQLEAADTNSAARSA